MQATTRQLDTPHKEPSSPFEELSIFKQDPDEFKKILEQDLDEKFCPKKDQVIDLCLSPLQIFSPPLNTENLENIKLEAVINLEKTLDLLLENISLLISHIHLSGVDQTSILIQQEGMLIDQTEIVIEHYDTAPGVFNIEIKACSKLQALLINQKGHLFERIEAIAPEIKINRFDISNSDSKEYISNTKQKKVVMGDKTQNDA